MHATLVVQRPAGVAALSAEELSKKLTDATQLPCTLGSESDVSRFVLGQNDVAVVLQIGSEKKPDAANVEFSCSTGIPNVVAVFRTFRALGWTCRI